MLVNIDMIRLHEAKIMRELRRAVPNCRVILKSSQNKPARMVEAYVAGASVFLSKGDSLSFLSAIEAVTDHL